MGNINVGGKDYIIGVAGNVEPAIEWQGGAVCFVGGEQRDADYLKNIAEWFAVGLKDFQLNNIRQGDYIEALELDNHKYHDAVEVFMLFGFEWGEGAVDSYNDVISMGSLTICHDGIFATEVTPKWCARKITFNQLMAIGELKRLELERDKEPQFGKNEDGSMKLVKSNFSEKPNSCEDATSKQEVRMQKNKPVVAQVMIDLTERMEIGIKTYGEALRANNGRDALQDAYEEALDLACYLKQAMIEKEIANYEKALKGGGSL